MTSCAFLGTGALVGALIFAVPSTAVAWCRSTTETSLQIPGQGCSACTTTGVPLAWGRPCLGVSVDARNADLAAMPLATIREVVGRAFGAWTDVACGTGPASIAIEETEPSVCRSAAYNQEGGNVSTIAFLPDWDNHDPPLSHAAFALTFVWFDTATGEIHDGDVLLNPGLGPYADCPETGCVATTGPTPIDLGNVLTHEAGHFLGLAHSDVAGSTMYCDGDRGEVLKRTLEPDDLGGFCAAYSEPPAGRCDFEPRGGLDLDCEDGVGVTPSGGGCSAAGASGGHASVIAFSLITALAWLLRARLENRTVRKNR